MFEIIDALKKGFDLWKQAWLTQIIALLVLMFVGFFIIIPFVFLIAITAVGGATIITDPNILITTAIIQAFFANPGFWFSIFALVFVGMIINTIVIGALQKVAHDYAVTGAGRFEDVIKALIPMIIPLAIVAIVTTLIAAIPILIVGEILNLFNDPTLPNILTFPLFQSTVGLDILEIITIMVAILLIILLGGPYYLSITTIAVEDAGMNGIVEGWKLYFRKFLSTIIAMIVLFIIIVIIVIVFFIPINGIVLAGSDLTLILLNVFILMVLGVIVGFLVNNWLYTSLYNFYQEIKT
ncbi:MAG: hypothetical protein ACFFC7_05000 [Candidatus Hermodarchaeota archaeon]